MPQGTKTHTVKVTGVSEELLRLLDGRVRERHASGRAEYIRELIRRDALGEKDKTFRAILAPVHEYSRQQNFTEDELDTFFDQVREESFAERHPGLPLDRKPTGKHYARRGVRL